MRYYAMILTILFLTISLLGCNTMRGLGKDIETAGDSIQRTVDDHD